MSEKELPASDQKIRKAREKGQVAVSQDLVSLLKMIAVFELAVALEGEVLEKLDRLLTAVLLTLQQTSIQPFTIRANSVSEAAQDLSLIALFYILMASAISWLGSLLQTRINVSSKVFAESLQKLNPISNLKQIFSLNKLLMITLGLLKISTVLIVLTMVLWDAIQIALQADRLAPLALWQLTIATMQELFYAAFFIMIGWAFLDVSLQRWLTRRSLRMDLKEIKDEYKEMEGDPHVKGYRNSTKMEILLSDNMMPKPAVVVVNPEHFAVALAYDYQAESVPVVVGKAVNDDVNYWRHLALVEDIPVIQFRSLARQLYATSKVGDFVPSPMLKSVALLFQAATEVIKAREADGDTASIYEIDEDLAKEILASAPTPSSL